MNELTPRKRSEMKRLLAMGASRRAIAEHVGCSTNTVARYHRMWEMAVTCGCGRPSGHSGWCSVRLDYSPTRLGWLQKRWKKRGDSELRQTVAAAQEAASEYGHTLGRFVWGSSQAVALAYAICRVCGKEVRVFAGDSQWSQRFGAWQRFAGGAVQTRCRTEAEKAAEAAAQQEKRQWREGKRTLLQLKQILRNPSSSRSVASIPERTSHP
jgi:hypothetical protein